MIPTLTAIIFAVVLGNFPRAAGGITIGFIIILLLSFPFPHFMEAISGR